jgi:hypothetical protein
VDGEPEVFHRAARVHDEFLAGFAGGCLAFAGLAKVEVLLEGPPRRRS